MIKEVRDIETNELTGYEYNGMHVPSEPSNRHYQEIQELIANGETVTPAFTEQERLDYFINKRTNELKQLRKDKVNQIKITLSTSEELDGDELSQTRFTKAITALSDDITEVAWIDANNNLVQLNRPKLQEALLSAGSEQGNIFVKYNNIRSKLSTYDINTLINGTIDWNNEIIVV